MNAASLQGRSQASPRSSEREDPGTISPPPQHPHHPGANTEQCSRAKELCGAGTGARCLVGPFLSLAPASPGVQLSPSDLPGSEGIGSGAGRQLFISVPHQRAAAGDATAALTARSG